MNTMSMLRRVWRLCTAGALVLMSGLTPHKGVSAHTPAGAGRERFFAQMQPADPPPAGTQEHEPRLAAHGRRAGSTTAADHTRVVFQSYRGGNWEVIRADGEFNNQQNMTVHPAADTRPELSFDGQRIVFASNRDGNFEIYTMNWDGSGLTRVTNTPAADFSPSWMPDGQIVFVSNRDQNNEIYVMKANGADQTRITYTEAYEYGPAALLTGKISYGRARLDSLQGELVVYDFTEMPSTVILSLNFLGAPAWSSDGLSMVFDGDVDGDTFTELFTRDAQGVIRKVYDPPGMTDALAGSWSPDGKLLAFSEVVYRAGGEDLIKERSILKEIPAAGGPTREIYGSFFDEMPNWRWNDVKKPVLRKPRGSGFYRLYWPTGYLEPVDLAVSDDRSGYVYADVDIRKEGSQEWVRLVSELRDLSKLGELLFRVGSGTFHFRVRVMDRAGNQRPWSTSTAGDFTLKVYMTELVARVMDGRGRALDTVTILETPEGFGPFVTGSDGRVTIPTQATTSMFDLSKQGFRNRSLDLALGQFPNARSTSCMYGNDSLWINDGAHNGATRTVYIEPDMHRPTFTYLGMNRPVRSFSITVASPVTSFVAFSYIVPPATDVVTEPLNLLCTFVDLSALRGQSITVEIHSGPNNPTREYVPRFDHLAIASWRTPVITDVTILSGTTAAPELLLISGENFMDGVTVEIDGAAISSFARLDEFRLRVALPPNLRPGRHDVVVTNPGGASSRLPAPLWIGESSFLPVVNQDG